MNNSSNQPEQRLDDVWSEFEQRLRDRSIGSGPQHRGKVLYQCGYAAGAAATSKKNRRAALRWRFTGLAASVLACVSLATHFIPFDAQSSEPLGSGKARGPSQAEVGKPERALASDSWIVQLTRERQGDQREASALRAGTTLNAAVGGDLDGEIESGGPVNHGGPLQPRDFTLFL